MSIALDSLALDFVAAAAKTSQFPLSFALVYAVGFVAAVGIGSVAWYNSKRPAGWEDKDRPDFIPEVKADETPAE